MWIFQFKCPAMVSARWPPLLCRLKVSGPYYSEFKQDSTALADSAGAAGAHPTAAVWNAAQPAIAALSAAAIRSRVEAAVAAVMGAVPAATGPLVEAGLDSLGGSLRPTSVHKCISGRGAGARFDSDLRFRVWGVGLSSLAPAPLPLMALATH